MEFRILGPLEAWEGDRPIPLGGHKALGLLAILLLQANHVVPRDRLIELLWGGNPPDTAGHALEVYASQLRQAFKGAGSPAVLVNQRPGYRLSIDRLHLDSWRFQTLVEEGQRDLAATRYKEAFGKLSSAL